MTWITELYHLLPEFVGYAAPGFLLVFSFNWVTSSQLRIEKNTVILSFVWSYLIWAVIGKSSQALSAFANIVVCILSILIGFGSAIIYKKESTNDFLCRIGIKRTTNNSIWDDLIGEGRWISIWCERENAFYCGHFKYQKKEDDIVFLALSTYYTANTNGEVLNNYTADRDRVILFQIKDIDKYIISGSDPFGHFRIK